MAQSTDSYGVLQTLEIGDRSYRYYSLAALAEAGFEALGRLPFSLKVLLENLLRGEDGVSVTRDDIAALANWASDGQAQREIAFRPARVLMQDFTGVPAVVDLATMREAMAELGGDPRRINPLSPVDLVIDHSVMVDAFGNAGAFARNVEMEFDRNGERYAFLRWGQEAFDNFRVVPPGTGICHQVNLEYLAQVVWRREEAGATLVYPDTLVGTDSHTTMVNGLSVLGWGVGGIEAEAAMLGQAVSMLIPEVVGLRFTGALKEGTTATDLVLTVTQMLRRHGVVGKFVEFCGPGLEALSLADRATIANMAPEYGATCGFFPIDEETLRYLRFTGRAAEQVALVEAYARAQGLWREAGAADPQFSDTLELDLATVEPSLAGPKRPQDRVALSAIAGSAREIVAAEAGGAKGAAGADGGVPVAGENYRLNHGDVVIAAITSCTNTSNPSVLVAAGLLARKARERGLTVKPWVKTSLAPGSQVVTEYLEAAGLQDDLDALGFDLVGYGCTTCIGNSGPLPEPISEAIKAGDLHVAAVLSGNRNFEGRVNPQTRLNYLASPPLVVAFALAGSITRDLLTEPLGEGADGAAVFLEDVWPSNREIRGVIDSVLTPKMFAERYADVFTGPEQWRAIGTTPSLTYDWQDDSSYVRLPPFFTGMTAQPTAAADVKGARILAMLGDSVTTDHISPAGAIATDSPAGRYLIERGVRPVDFNRGDDARHLRQHPDSERTGAGHRGRAHPPPARRRGRRDLRRRARLSGRRRAPGGRRRQGIRHRLVARLGGQGHAALGRAGGDRRILRAHPPLQPDRHGRAAIGLHRRRDPQDPGADRRGDRRHRRHRSRPDARRGTRLPHRPPRRQRQRDHPAVPDRHRRRARLLQQRRHPPLRAAGDPQGGVTGRQQAPEGRPGPSPGPA